MDFCACAMRRIDGFVYVCARHSDVSDSCLCVQMPFHIHALSVWLCLVPSLSFRLSGLDSKPARTEKRSRPSFHSFSSLANTYLSSSLSLAKTRTHQC